MSINLSIQARNQHVAFQAKARRVAMLFVGHTAEKAVENADALIRDMIADLREFRMTLRGELAAAKAQRRADDATCAGLPLVNTAYDSLAIPPMSVEPAPEAPPVGLVRRIMGARGLRAGRGRS